MDVTSFQFKSSAEYTPILTWNNEIHYADSRYLPISYCMYVVLFAAVHTFCQRGLTTCQTRSEESVTVWLQWLRQLIKCPQHQARISFVSVPGSSRRNFKRHHQKTLQGQRFVINNTHSGPVGPYCRRVHGNLELHPSVPDIADSEIRRRNLEIPMTRSRGRALFVQFACAAVSDALQTDRPLATPNARISVACTFVIGLGHSRHSRTKPYVTYRIHRKGSLSNIDFFFLFFFF